MKMVYWFLVISHLPKLAEVGLKKKGRGGGGCSVVCSPGGRYKSCPRSNGVTAAVLGDVA